MVDVSLLGRPLKRQLLDLSFGQHVLTLQHCQDETVRPCEGTTTGWVVTGQDSIHDCFAAWSQPAEAQIPFHVVALGGNHQYYSIRVDVIHVLARLQQ